RAKRTPRHEVPDLKNPATMFDRLNKHTVLPQFVVALKWICGLGSHAFKLKILDPNLDTLQIIGDFPIQFKAKTDVIHADFPIINFNFDKVGVYWIEIILNDISHLSIPLPVHQLQS
ncbi:MAG: hypothetical protein OXH36_04245, partial [Bdellovibrionales bacterium]|nr:hypothetical protein [Bdellovibrionales bacterium]